MYESLCIYCRKDASTASGKEHIIPESLGCNETLPKGYVCDSCNNYFGNSIDRSVFHNRAIAYYVGSEEILGKKGKPRRNIGKYLSFPKKGYMELTLSATIPPKKPIREIEFSLKQDNEFNDLEFARGIHKIATIDHENKELVFCYNNDGTIQTFSGLDH